MTRFFSLLFLLFKAALWIPAALFAIWACGALYYDFPVATTWVAGAFALLLLALVVFLRGALRKLAALILGPACVLAWWLTLTPRNDRSWQPEVAQTAWAEIHGDEVTMHNVRNLDYRTTTDFTPRWETRTVRLSQLTGIDLAVCYWGSPWMAHPIVSFQFADAPPLCFSIETRKEVGEKYSAIGGLFRQYELAYVVADERDVLQVRTNFRKGEDVYLYRLKITPEKARERFVEYLTTINDLKEKPRWYNAITTNCTTSIRTQHAAAKRQAWDWRILVNGKGDELLYERGSLQTGGLPFAELKPKARINDAAQQHGSDPAFSQRIRENRPGFEEPKAPAQSP